jgi:hypothetical protein
MALNRITPCSTNFRSRFQFSVPISIIRHPNILKYRFFTDFLMAAKLHGSQPMLQEIADTAVLTIVTACYAIAVFALKHGRN